MEIRVIILFNSLCVSANATFLQHLVGRSGKYKEMTLTGDRRKKKTFLICIYRKGKMEIHACVEYSVHSAVTTAIETVRFRLLRHSQHWFWEFLQNLHVSFCLSLLPVITHFIGLVSLLCSAPCTRKAPKRTGEEKHRMVVHRLRQHFAVYPLLMLRLGLIWSQIPLQHSLCTNSNAIDCPKSSLSDCWHSTHSKQTARKRPTKLSERRERANGEKVYDWSWKENP